MNTIAKLFTGTVALALATSTILTASGASARPYDYDRYNGHDNGAAWWKGDRNDRHSDRDYRFNDRDDRYNDRDYRFNNRNIYRQFNRRNNVYIYPPSRRGGYYGNSIVRLPDGCRRVVYRDRVYYTRDNDVYYSYDSDRRGFIVVNFPGVRIGF
jgi:hypothetical protein